jgi:hypothetical protein
MIAGRANRNEDFQGSSQHFSWAVFARTNIVIVIAPERHGKNAGSGWPPVIVQSRHGWHALKAAKGMVCRLHAHHFVLGVPLN